MLEHRRILANAKDAPQQAQLGPHLRPQAGMATQLAHVYQRNHQLLPLEFVNLREQHGHPTPAVRGSVRLLR